jgi:NADH:ubiquinone oxidoreductase subunit F (NADH-binding)
MVAIKLWKKPQHEPEEIIDWVDKSQLRGRVGQAFPPAKSGGLQSKIQHPVI